MFIKYVILVIKQFQNGDRLEFKTKYVQLDQDGEKFNLTDDPSEAFLSSDRDEAFLLSLRFGGHVVTRQPTKEVKAFWWET